MAAAMANTGAVRRTDPQLVRFCNEDLLLPERLEADRVEAQMADGFLLGCVVAAIAPSVGLRLPVGDARDIDPADLMPHERAALFGWADTEVQP